MSFGTLITGDERRKLQSLESVVARGQKAFVEVGCALAEIRNSKLYRADFKTFEDYCREKWGWEKRHAYRLIEAADVAKTCPVGHELTNERQARELAKVEPAARAEVLEIAAEAGPVTADAIRQASEEYQAKQVVGSVPQPKLDPDKAVKQAAENLRRWQITMEDLKSIFVTLPPEFKSEFIKWAKNNS